MKLSTPISGTLAQVFRGVVDFYYWKGIPVARAWPRKPKQPGTVAQKTTWTNLGLMLSWRNSNPHAWLAHWQAQPFPPATNAEAQLRSAGLHLAYAGNLVGPPVLTHADTDYDAPSDTTTAQLWPDMYTGYVPSAIAWRYHTDTDPATPLAWYQSGAIVDRSGRIIPKYKPNVSDFRTPATATWDPPTQRYVLTWPGHSDFWRLLPSTVAPSTAEIMYSPPVSTHNLSPP